MYNRVMNWDLATDIILYAAIALVGFFALLGFCEWIKRKSFKKIDQPLKTMPIPLILMVVIYIVFDYFLILGTAPNDPTKPSFPSTHAMVVTTIFALTALALPHYLKTKTLRFALCLIMLALLAITAFGRVISGNHSEIDVACGIVFGVILGTIYYLTLKEKK
ncbi:MAG: phosphatase PAP2 family protein [Candidatus Saccharibacteria bacterium]|nr:phosphatase PAP2 family protein [Candidatus Saccharibacteria bacterium]